MAGNLKPGELAAAGVTSPAPLDALTQDTLEERRSQRSFKYWVGKVIVGCIAFCFVAVVLGMVYSYVVKGTSMQGGVIEQFLKTFSDIMNILFSSPPVPKT